MHSPMERKYTAKAVHGGDLSVVFLCRSRGSGVED